MSVWTICAESGQMTTKKAKSELPSIVKLQQGQFACCWEPEWGLVRFISSLPPSPMSDVPFGNANPPNSSTSQTNSISGQPLKQKHLPVQPQSEPINQDPEPSEDNADDVEGGPSNTTKKAQQSSTISLHSPCKERVSKPMKANDWHTKKKDIPPEASKTKAMYIFFFFSEIRLTICNDFSLLSRPISMHSGVWLPRNLCLPEFLLLLWLSIMYALILNTSLQLQSPPVLSTMLQPSLLLILRSMSSALHFLLMGKLQKIFPTHLKNFTVSCSAQSSRWVFCHGHLILLATILNPCIICYMSILLSRPLNRFLLLADTVIFQSPWAFFPTLPYFKVSTDPLFFPICGISWKLKNIHQAK